MFGEAISRLLVLVRGTSGQARNTMSENTPKGSVRERADHDCTYCGIQALFLDQLISNEVKNN